MVSLFSFSESTRLSLFIKNSAQMELFIKKKYFSQQNALAFSIRQIKYHQIGGPTFKIGLAKKIGREIFCPLRNINATTGVTKNLG